ncbi:hypothetical protein FBU59_005631 [Linderina macrospora]|uniref:Uncharacterized protein n=1 Tax=Linderina macrospora TaxID=4868 RepID=A0ACC1J215_9FUNG|nr:hypothetical protein FBU59_005631 [Linderina macrospora]
MSRKRQEITEKTPKTPRKVVIYSDNLMTSKSVRFSTTAETAQHLVRALGDTLNTALVVSTSFRFDPELNMLEILDPYNPRNNIFANGITDYEVSVKLFLLPAATDTHNRPSPLYVRQALACIQKQLGSVKIDEFFTSFIDISSPITTDAMEEASDTESGSSSDGGSGKKKKHSSDVLPDDMARYVKIWRVLGKFRASGEIGKIGLSDFSLPQLRQLMELSQVKPDMLQVKLAEDSSAMGDGLDRDLMDYARAQGVSLRTHTDSLEILTDRTFQNLANDFKINERFPTTEVPPAGYKIDLMRPRWVANYSVSLKNRGLVANRGFIVMASSDCVLDPNGISYPTFL